MSPAIEFPDLELWLADYFRAGIPGCTAGRRFPDPKATLSGYWLVVRDDSGPDLSIVTAARRVAVTVIGPESAGHAATRAVAERAASLLRTSPAPGDVSPVAACEAVRGPYSLDATGRIEYYLTADLVVVGKPITT